MPKALRRSEKNGEMFLGSWPVFQDDSLEIRVTEFLET